MSKPTKQKETPNVHLLAVLEILKSGYWYDKKVQEVLKPFGISHEQYNVLRILEHHHPRKFSLKEIQNRLMNKTANTTRLVEKLRVKGYVTSAYTETNRRTLRIGITKSGLNLQKRISSPIMELGKQVSNVLDEKDAERLAKILRKFRSF
jgi:MarR family 2-MHQ and catechol resistance regulon transcriptional repressor